MNQRLDRRHFFESLVGALNLLASASLFAQNSPNRLEKKSLLYAIGNKSKSKQSISGGFLTQLDLNSHQIRQAEIPANELHSVIRVNEYLAVVSNDRDVVLLDSDLRIVRKFSCSDQLELGGHAVFVPDHRQILVGVKPAKSTKLPLTGKLLVLDGSTLKKIDEIPSGGFDPHDIQMINRDQFAVCNYGDRYPEDLLSYDKLEPNICIFDAKTLKLKQVIDVPKMGSISHVVSNGENEIAAINAILYPLIDQNKALVRNLVGSDFDISTPEKDETRLGGPSNVFAFKDGVLTQSFLSQPVKQRRAQSIAYHTPTKSIFVTYSYSNFLGCIRDGKTSLISGKDLGLESIRGVAVHHQSIFVNGQHRGIVELSSESLKIENRWDVDLFNAIHLYI